MANSIYNTEDIFEVTPSVILDLKNKAMAASGKRFRLCLHHHNRHKTQEMLIVFYKDSYMPPHRHPTGKSESYHIVQGEMTVYFFNDDGKIFRTIRMGDVNSGKTFFYRLSGNIWHMPVPKSEWLVYHETYTGPFEKDLDVEFPDWAPKEADRNFIEKYLLSLEKGEISGP